MIYAFDNYELDTRLHELRCASETVALEPLAFKVLTYLVQHRNHAVSKDELIEHLWSGQFMSDAVLVQSVVKARRAIGDNGQAQRCIKTVMGHGYRFIAPVEEYDAVGYAGQARAPIPLWPETYRMMRQDENELLLEELPLADQGQALAILHELLGRGEGGQEAVVLLAIRLGVSHAVRAKRGQCVDAALHALPLLN